APAQRVAVLEAVGEDRRPGDAAQRDGQAAALCGDGGGRRGGEGRGEREGANLRGGHRRLLDHGSGSAIATTRPEREPAWSRFWLRSMVTGPRPPMPARSTVFGVAQ